ncbi:MAG: dihydroneopterin aldolase family protein [Halodesulfurarchaeum sp.]
MPTDAETAAFEVGIKFGSLYHQFAGTPVSPGSAGSLERAIEQSIANQPYATAVDVDLDRERIGDAASDHGYVELTGEFMDVEIHVAYEGVSARAAMEMEDGYPRMRLLDVDA